jgi:hypothetical protein
MPFVFKKDLEHGAGNPIVARLSLQILGLLQQTKLSKAQRDAVGLLYHDGLMKKLLTCFEIRERFRAGFNEAVAAIEASRQAGGGYEIPQIPRLDAEARNFLVEAKGFIRDLLRVVNLLYGTDFGEASEFTRAKKNKKGAVSLIDFANATFGADDLQTKGLREAGALVDHVVALRNAAEHPEGYSGTLIVRNFEVTPAGIDEPTWHREKNGKEIHQPSSIRADFETILDGLLIVAEEIFVSWAEKNLGGNGMIVIAQIPEDKRKTEAPVRFATTLRPDLAATLAKMERGRE